jgi:hypothetical protein
MKYIPAFLTAAALTAAPLAAQGGIDTFDSGSNPNGWEFNGFVPPVVESTGGNPGGWLHGGPGLFALIPTVTSGASAGSPFVGDWRLDGVSGFEFDAQILSGPGGFGPMALMLIDDNGTSIESDDNHAYVLGAGSPSAGIGWVHYTFPVPSGDTSPLPSGWVAGSGTGVGNGFLVGYDWNDLIQNVTAVKIYFNDPQIFGITQTWDVGFDNLEVVATPTTFFLSGPTPGQAGQQNTLDVINATPGGLVAFAGGRNAGSTAVSCVGSIIQIDMLQPQQLGIVPANGAGEAALSAPAPAFLTGFTVYLQAVDVSTCGVSNLVTYTFP